MNTMYLDDLLYATATALSKRILIQILNISNFLSDFLFWKFVIISYINDQNMYFYICNNYANGNIM